MIYKYWVDDEMDEFREFESVWENYSADDIRKYIAEDAAKNYYQRLSDTCNYWPEEIAYVFHVFREDGYMIGIFKGSLEYVPSLSATEEPITCQD